MSSDQPCEHCDSPDSSLLRVVLIGEIIRADEATLYTLVDICATLGVLEFSEFEEPPLPASRPKRVKHRLRRVK